MTKPVIDLALDSGAYSAFTKGKEIDINKYCEFLLANQPSIYHAVNLDVINPSNPEAAAAAGWKNFVEMRSRGIDVMPVFHARESVKWLDKMLDETDYVGLSGTSLVSPSENLAWHNLTWNHVTDAQGKPVAKFHAFGDTSPHSMRTYPFFSADSATWQIASGKTGCIYIQGKPYQLRTKKLRNNNYLSLDDPKLKREVWEEHITKCGINVDMLMRRELRAVELTMIRCYLNCKHLLEVGELSKGVTSYKKNATLCGTLSSRPGIERDERIKMFFVVSTAVCPWGLPVLTALGITNVLISYFYLEQRFWPELQRWLYDPHGECQRNPKFSKYWNILQEFLC